MEDGSVVALASSDRIYALCGISIAYLLIVDKFSSVANPYTPSCGDGRITVRVHIDFNCVGSCLQYFIRYINILVVKIVNVAPCVRVVVKSISVANTLGIRIASSSITIVNMFSRRSIEVKVYIFCVLENKFDVQVASAAFYEDDFPFVLFPF